MNDTAPVKEEVLPVLDTESLKDWVTELRGDKYAQGQSCLRANDSYCCLGVLCDILNPDGWEIEGDNSLVEVEVPWVAPGIDPSMRHRAENCSESTLPDVTHEALGLTTQETQALVELNDTAEAPFSHIADVIENWILNEDNRKAFTLGGPGNPITDPLYSPDLPVE